MIEESSFVTIEPGRSETVTSELYIPFIDDFENVRRHSLSTGDHVLQLVVWTWLDSKSFATRLREEWKSRGFLWTKNVVSQPTPLTISKNKTVSKCS
jgi:hypothetical protein